MGIVEIGVTSIAGKQGGVDESNFNDGWKIIGVIVRAAIIPVNVNHAKIPR